MILNLLITVILVFNYGLIGVAIGTLAALVYRTIYLALYLSKNIIDYKITYFIKNVIVDITEVILISVITMFIPKVCNNYLEWIVLACEVFGISLMVILISNLLAYREHTVSLLKGIIRRIVRH